MILSLFIVLSSIIQTSYDKYILENTVIKTVKDKYIDSKRQYILMSEDRYFVEVSSDEYDDVNIGDERRDYWVK